MQNSNKKIFRPSWASLFFLQLACTLFLFLILDFMYVRYRFHSYSPIICIKIYINVIVLSEAKWDLGNLKSPSYVKWMFKTFIQRITWLVDQAQSLPCCFCGSTMYKEAVRRQRTLLLVFISVHIFRYVISVVYIWLLLNFHISIF